MRVGLYNSVDGGKARFEAWKEKYGDRLEIVEFGCAPTMENLDLIKKEQVEGLIYYNSKHEGEEFFRKMAEMGVRYLSTTSVGYDHFDVNAMRKYGIRGANVPRYSPNAVSEHTLLLTLSTLRNYREQLKRIENNDYRIAGVMARELRNMTVGIIGCGRIGAVTLKCLSGFGPKKIYAYDLFERDDVRALAEYTDLDGIYRNCDVIIFHANLTEENYHMINDAAIAKMKKGVVLINAARGQLMDADALVRGMESGQIGGLALDVIEQEELVRDTHDLPECMHPQLKKLKEFPTFTYTQHTAFFTDEAFRDLTWTALQNLIDYAETGSCEREVTGV